MSKTKLLSIIVMTAFVLPVAAQNTGGGKDDDPPFRTKDLPDSLRRELRQNSLEMVWTGRGQSSGGVKGKVVNRSGRVPVQGAELQIFKGEALMGTVYASSDGAFLFENLDNGLYLMKVSAPGFLPSQVNVEVEGFMKDLMFVSLLPSNVVNDIDDSNFADFDMDDSGYEDAPSILYGNDVFANIAGYDFSAVRFRNRGYNSETQDVYLSGVRMNDALTGYTPWSLWSGLNEAMRSKETTMGLEVSEYGTGGFNGVTNILAMPSNVRPGFRFSLLTNSALYRLRAMASYASGMLDNGWSYAFNVSARLGGNDWVDGVYYRSFAYYGAVEKKFNDTHSLGFVIFATPGQRGAQNASTQEVYDLVGSNTYNSNWGYQDGKMRNARVRKTHEPVMILKYTATPSDGLEATATLLYRTGKNGYTALDWYDAPDPRPDYYRYLPSYFYMEDPDYDRIDIEKAAWATEAWQNNVNGTRHMNWDRLYNVNYNNVTEDGRRSKYTVEERRTDQNDVNFAGSVKWRAEDWFTLNGGVDLKWNRTEYYKIMNDLLGGDYYLNIDQFAERDFASSPTMIQNDLDYFLEHGQAQMLGQGDKYGYDYYAHVRKAGLWATASFEKGNFKGYASLEGGYTSFWREGLVRKGLFAGLDDNGNEIVYEGKVLTTYDSEGRAITSKGKSDVSQFFTYTAKAGAAYFIPGGHRVYANVGYLTDAPTFSQAFVSPRTRNTLVSDLRTTKTFSADLNYQFSRNGYDIRVTGFYTKINDQTDVMSFYDDSQNSFTNFAMSGIDQRHAGIELGFKIPVPVQGLSVQGVLSWGEYVYTSTPRMTQTVDNSASVIFEDELVPYWSSHPVYRKETVNGTVTYPKDEDGRYIVERKQKHYVPSTPQLAASLGLNYASSSYWFADLNVNYFGNTYLDMNPLYRTDMATAGPDGVVTPAEIEYMAAQEKFDPVFLLNASVGKSWYINRKYNIGFSLEVKNILNNRGVRTGGYEQTRLIDSKSGERYYRFDSKYFYMSGVNYMLNLYFRF